MVADPITAVRTPPPTPEEVNGLANRIVDLIVSEGASRTLALSSLATALGCTIGISFTGRDRGMARIAAQALMDAAERGAVRHG